MCPEAQTAKEMALATPFIKGIYDIWIKPKLEELRKNNEMNKKLIKFNFENDFEEYLSRTYEKNSFINTIVFQNQ